MADVFVSYKKSDKVRAEALVRDLQAHDFTVWWDYELESGDRWLEKLIEEVEAARCLVGCWTNNALTKVKTFAPSTSGVNYLQMEHEIAGWQKIAGVVLDEGAVPVMYKDRQYNDLINWEPGDFDHPGFQTLLQQIRKTSVPSWIAGELAQLRIEAKRHLNDRKAAEQNASAYQQQLSLATAQLREQSTRYEALQQSYDQDKASWQGVIKEVEESRASLLSSRDEQAKAQNAQTEALAEVGVLKGELAEAKAAMTAAKAVDADLAAVRSQRDAAEAQARDRLAELERARGRVAELEARIEALDRENVGKSTEASAVAAGLRKQNEALVSKHEATRAKLDAELATLQSRLDGAMAKNASQTREIGELRKGAGARPREGVSPIISLLAVLLAMAAGLFLGPRLFGEGRNIATEGIQNSADLTSPAAPAPAVPDPEQTALDKLRGRWGLFNGDATDCAAPAEIRISDKKSLTIVDRGQPSVETIERIDPAGPVHTVSGAQKSVYSIAGDMLSVSVDGAEPSRYKSCE